MFRSLDFTNLESDGILGLSPKSLHKGEAGIAAHLFVYELKKDRVIDKAIFLVFLGILNTKDIRNPKEVKSKVIFGGYD